MITRRGVLRVLTGLVAAPAVIRIPGLLMPVRALAVPHRVIYVRSGATGIGSGTDWVNAFTSLRAAAAGGQTGDELRVSPDHVEWLVSTVFPRDTVVKLVSF